jgi:hypothetical protein
MNMKSMFGVELCQCEDPYLEGPFDGITFCETCHGVIKYDEKATATLPEIAALSMAALGSGN